MRAKKSRRLSAADRRARVLAAALRAFAEGGYDGVSMNEIAIAAGVTKPVLYDHFPSKQQLYVAVLESIRDDLLGRGASIAQRPIGPEQRCRAAIQAFFQYAAERPQEIQVLLQIPHTDPVAARLWKRVQDGASAGIASLLGTLWTPDEKWVLPAAAEFVKSGLHALAQWRRDHPDIEVSQLVDVVMRIIWGGISSVAAG
jgi:AcrR family transcriptional regulator